MISRVAEHCFWLSRYLERAENTARVLDVNHTLLLDFHVPIEQQWRPLLIISGIHDYDGPATAEAVQEYLTWDRGNPCSIASSLAQARENGRIIREVISAEMWERLNYYHHWMNSEVARGWYRDHRSEFYGQIRRINQMLHGIGEATMAHGEPWDFYRLGKYLERGCQTARILDVKYHMRRPRGGETSDPVDHAHWTAILMSCSGYEPFHKKPRAPMDPGWAVAEFLILDREFPRSVSYCLWQCVGAAAAIAEGAPHAPSRALSLLVERLDRSDIADIVRVGLHETLTAVVNAIHEIGDAIRQTYFEAPLTLPPTS